VTGTLREIVATHRAPQGGGAGGMPVRNPFTPEAYGLMDPFLYCAHFGPRDIRETGWGFPAHPHKGFETITYMLDGWLEHRDSFGAHAILEPGDVQWMTAGRGIVHSELPPEDFVRRGGLVEGLQIWLNLPAGDKLAAPGFQMLRGADMPVVERGDASVRVIAGALDGEESGITTHAPLLLFHAALPAGARITLPAPARHGAAAYVVRGEAAGTLTVFGETGDSAAIENATGTAADILYLSGQRLPQPVAAHGPFVMGSRDEIIAAIDEYQTGQMGTIPA
jgi:redox-sensitive bicupin YhaK (pirin superfamily)